MANANYAIPATFAIEQVLPTKFTHIAAGSHPFLAKILGRKAEVPSPEFMIENRSFGGTKLLMPISATLTTVEGVTKSGMWTDLSISEPGSGTASHAEYNFASYRGSVNLDAREIRLLSDNPQSRQGLSIVEQRVGSMVATFRKTIEGHLSSATADGENRVLGMRYGLSTSATPGNISQTTYTDWAAQVSAVSAAFNISQILRGINATRVDRVDGVQKSDIAFASEMASGYVYSAIQNAIGALQVVYDKESVGRYGHDNFIVAGTTVVCPQTVASGEVHYFRTANWAYVGDDMPVLLEPSPTRDKGSSIVDWHYTWMAAVGCNDWGRQGKQTGITTS